MLFTDFSRGCYFDGMIYAETILAEAQERKRMDYTPELNYQTIVKKIGTWIEGWLDEVDVGMFCEIRRRRQDELHVQKETQCKGDPERTKG